MVFRHCKGRVSVEPKHCGENPICSVAMRFESMFGSRRLESYAIIVLSEKVHSHCTFTMSFRVGIEPMSECTCDYCVRKRFGDLFNSNVL